MLERDRAWLDAFRRGERDALTRVFHAFVDDMAKTLRAGVVVTVDGQRVRVGARLPEHELEALLQETFAKAFAPRARQAYDGVRPYGAYLATIARNLLIDRARQERRDARVIAVDDLADVPEASSETDPTWRIEEEQIGRIVGEVEADLGEPDLSIFRLRFKEQKTFRETAAALGLTEIVVRRRDTRLRARLLDLLRAQGFLENVRVRIGTSLLSRKHRQVG